MNKKNIESSRWFEYTKTSVTTFSIPSFTISLSFLKIQQKTRWIGLPGIGKSDDKGLSQQRWWCCVPKRWSTPRGALASKKDCLPEGYWPTSSVSKLLSTVIGWLVGSGSNFNFALGVLTRFSSPTRSSSKWVCLHTPCSKIRPVPGVTNPTAKWAEIKLNLNWEICYTQNGFRTRPPVPRRGRTWRASRCDKLVVPEGRTERINYTQSSSELDLLIVAKKEFISKSFPPREWFSVFTWRKKNNFLENKTQNRRTGTKMPICKVGSRNV